MRHLKVFSLLLFTIALSTPSSGETDVRAIVKEIDELYRAESSYSEFEMEIQTPHWQRTLAGIAWSQGMDKTFLRLTAPRKEKGVATLRIENEMWNYLPKTEKVIKVPPSMMMSSWMGSDFTNDDLVKEFSLFDDYTYEETTVEDASDDLIYINCIPREDLAIVWGNIIIAVQRDGHIPAWQRYYDEKGVLMRVLSYSEPREFGGRLIPAVLEMVPTTKEGHKTVIRYLKLEFNVDAGDGIFSLRHLQSKN